MKEGDGFLQQDLFNFELSKTLLLFFFLAEMQFANSGDSFRPISILKVCI